MPNDKIQYLVLNRVYPNAKIAWFCVLSIDASLFGDVALIREWERIGTTGQRKIELYESESRAVEVLEAWLHRKQRRGYLKRHRFP